ncbi:hypothetical protein PHISCL_08667 [Aspergillus sclerotialis]|uniref:Uncharacterized protein n=1 Tax=Aspergillus sclerotialis TaxID=2070753 RepID=A0A3A2ZM93_9EURO|nr:hypothetical protein PHISCL_08667 [Aspergillus sclerotialis]
MASWVMEAHQYKKSLEEAGQKLAMEVQQARLAQQRLKVTNKQTDEATDKPTNVAKRDICTMSLNQDQLVIGPINPEADTSLKVELYTVTQQLHIKPTWSGIINYQQAKFDTIPKGLAKEQLQKIVRLFPSVGRATMTAMPAAEQYQFIYVEIEKGQSGNGETFTRNAHIGDKALKGITYLWIRVLSSGGMPCYNELDSYLLDTCRFQKNTALDILQKFQEGFVYHDIDRCRLIFETKLDWQGYEPAEIKWWNCDSNY